MKGNKNKWAGDKYKAERDEMANNMKKRKIKTTRGKEKEGFKAQFREAWKYLRESKNYIWAIALIFLGGALLGFVFSGSLGFLDEFLREIVGQIEGLSSFETIIFILQNNLASSFYGILLGVVLGIFPVLNALLNGVLVGYVFKLTWLDSGISEFWKILPHGIFELPAAFISLGLGLRLGMFVFSKHKWKEFMKRARNSIIIFVCVVIPLLIVAAVIEGLLIGAYK